MATDRSDSKKRFSSRVDAYAKYRPGYPQEVVELLQRECGLSEKSNVGDVGSGTGIFSEMLLQSGATVFGVEPNADMRTSAEKSLATHPNFRSVDGSGERTMLPNSSVDLVTCAQAFHWLDRATAAAEFKRIARPGGFVAILWNARRTDSSAFLREYDELLRKYGTDYAKVAHEKSPVAQADLAYVFGVPIQRATFENEQRFDREGLRGRVESSSYTPMPGEKGYEELFTGLDDLFARRAREGRVVIEYDTEVFYAQLGV